MAERHPLCKLFAQAMFQPPDSNIQFPTIESEIIRFWRDQRIYERSLEARQGAPEFVFYEGPPTANGLPHPGHCLTRAIKDLFPRYRTMRGFHCRRKAGWDTHGLPVEVEVCKELGIHSKEEIEAYGVEPFIHRCLESVFRYTQQWERLTERLGFWINLDEAYVTYHQSYVESVWWALKQLFDRGLLYQGHKIVWWWAQGGTALSSGEVGQGYRQVADPSVYVRFPLVDDPDAALVVWTTTPWTLPSNQFAAVHPEIEYTECEVSGGDEHAPWHPAPGQRIIVAAELVASLAEKFKLDLKPVRTHRGEELVGRTYLPPFDYYHAELGSVRGELVADGEEQIAWRVVSAEFVTIESGTGVVHLAPAFGEVDFDVLQAQQQRFVDGQGPDLLCAVGPDGRFTSDAPPYEGRWVKEADKDISRDLRSRGLLVHLDQYLHDYPFCWRAEEDPLIQYPRQSWFVRTTAYRERMLENNSRINWLPEHIRDGRFGNFLEANVDWALSRERYWGTPLPIWVCEETGQIEAISSYAELLAKPGVAGVEVWEQAKAAQPELSDHLRVHKPYIDAITYDSPFADGKRMRRVSEVIDCWFDSGAMPFAQWGYPHAGQADFKSQFPADFISEALDQTRGWFYSQLAISTLLFGPPPADVADGNMEPVGGTTPEEFPHPFRNCIVLGLMLGEDGTKMSKSKRNYREPSEIFDKYGADALRWYFFANQPPWTSIRYREDSIRESIPEFLLRLWNTYSFFVIYADIDGFDPAADLQGEVGQLRHETFEHARWYRKVCARGELDRWIMSELNRTIVVVTERMDAYDNFGACAQLSGFLDALSNWYVRRSRERFWAKNWDAHKADAYWTLYECLLSLCKLVAPFTPFIAEALWQRLAVAPFGELAIPSVHLCDYPMADESLIDANLSEQMELMREIVSLGRNARMQAKLKVRQPLTKVEVILVNKLHQQWLEAHGQLIREELNVKQVEFPAAADHYIDYSVMPDLKRLGPRLGKNLPVVKKLLGELPAAELLHKLESEGQVVLLVGDEDLVLDREDLLVRLQAKPGWVAAQGTRAVVVISTELTDALRQEGLAREVVHAIQGRRKDLGCQFTDRIEIGLVTSDPHLLAALQEHKQYLMHETLALDIYFHELAGVELKRMDVEGHPLDLYVQAITSGH